MYGSSTVLRATLSLLLPFGLLLAGEARAVTFLVGSDASCSHTNLQSAINALPAGSQNNIIHLTNTQTLSSIALTIDGKSVDVIGGYASCSAAQPTPATTTVLDGAGNGGHSVIKLSGNSAVTLENLTIQHGHQGSDSHGGGINFTGHGNMTLRNDVVSSNSCGWGAGINVTPDGTTFITIATNTLIAFNQADHSGGGIRIEGNTFLQMSDPATLIYDNSARDGSGGGIDILGPARADIGSPGYANLGAIYGNSAAYGGGISVSANGDSYATSSVPDALLRLYTTDPAHPVSVSANRASEKGGGVYLQGYAFTSHPFVRARMCANDFQISANIARDGSGIFAERAPYGNDFFGSAVYLNLDSSQDTDGFCTAPGPMLGAMHCNAGAACNTVSSGIAADANGFATDGAAITIAEDGRYLADYLQVVGNRGGYAMRMETNNGVTARTRTCLIADNVLTSALIKSDGNSPVEFDECTLAHNEIDRVFALDDDLSLLRSIISQPNKTSLVETNPNAIVKVRDVIATEVASLDPTEPTLKLAADARFIDPAHGDYHLQAASPGVDFYDTPVGTNARDLDGNGYMIDLPQVPNRFGASDLGAYERQSIGNLVLNDRFDQDLRLWTLAATGTTFDPSKNAVGTMPSGSAHIDVPRSAAAVRGLSQCIHIPGPGTYQLNASAYAPGNLATGHDLPSINWRLRYNSNACTSLLIDQGDLSIPAGSTSWHQALAPASIAVSASLWTQNTTIEVALVVTEGNSTLGGDTSAWFDGISLVPQP